MKDQPTLETAFPLARALAERQVDPNEFAKSFTHLRALLERAGDDQDKQRAAVKDWWRWLETVAGPGARAVVRSARTQDYYHAIEDACLHHLKLLEADPEQFIQTLGWAVRLMRYYRAEPGALDRPGPFASVEAAPQPKAAAKPAAKARELPTIGDVFNGQVIQIDESAVVVEVPGFAADKALGVIKVADLAGRKYREGNSARVEVIGVRALKNGRTVVELKPVKREGE